MTSEPAAIDQSTVERTFLADYYEHLIDDDAQNYTDDVLQERALAHWQVARIRKPKTANVDVRTEKGRSVVFIVTDDMPFLVDSVIAELVRQQSAIHLVVHPLLIVARNRESNELVSIARMPANVGVASGDTSAMPSISHLIASGGNASHLESWIAIEIDAAGEAARQQLIDGLTAVLDDVRAAVEDWSLMRRKAIEIADNLSRVAHGEQIHDLRQTQDLLRWLESDNFTFLGYREYDLEALEGEDVLSVREGSGLGLLRSAEDRHQIQHLTEAGRTKARERTALVITKANSRSTVHRPAFFDYIGIKSFDENGLVSGEQRFIGLFAASAYTSSVEVVPVLREKVSAVLSEVGFPPGSHSGKDLLGIMETYPRDELFQIEVPALVVAALAIQRLQERRRTRLFLRPDVYGRFMSALVYLPRDRYNTAVRLRIERELRDTFAADSLDFEARMTESALARLFYRIRLPQPNAVDEIDALALERRLAMAVRSWPEGILDELRGMHPLEEADRLAAVWAEAFPDSYRVDYEVEDALEDIVRFEACALAAVRAEASGTAPVRPGLHVYIPEASDSAPVRVKLYMMESQSLSQILPYFQNLGIEVLDEVPFGIETSDGREFFLYDLGLVYPDGVDPLATGELLADSFGAAVSGAIESDSLDRLVLREGMAWQRVVILRSYAKYLRQMGNTNSYEFVANTLIANPVVASGLVALFEARFDPDLSDDERTPRVAEVRAQLAAAMEEVATLDADRVLRTFINLIEASLRTNFFQTKPYLSIKLDPTDIALLPFPRPKYEIWVYSPRVEGVHLRFGKVARGGLRWSDRKEDFRTEVLGLVKAQTVKNAVIVPTGAKGGFFAKKLPNPAVDRAAWMAEGVDSYKTFIRGLLDLTDNLVTTPDEGERMVPPPRVVSHDDADTYLVVAADKGTASFSDIANGLAAEYGFWLGDAFASGGSVGYDHKEMGITARGAWESVKRHFSELDVDSQNEDFTVVGVGDMSGDVFGNGMLLSRHIRLVAAFDHRHIFLDPNPDAAISFEERARLFALPRSSWMDYSAELISGGGGVYPRQAKSVPISAEVRVVLGLAEGTTRLSPPELLRAILTAPADLLYNGGIGTYVKASTETAAQVGDKANDGIRVDGKDLRVKVVGEGGNLGLTQLGRIEAARNGVILNTDAIDNSAGVDCSDHEVNIKIFVDRMVAEGKLDPAERSEFLAEMTDEVGRLVLQDNVDQNILLLNDRVLVNNWSPSYERLMNWLESAGDLQRDLEALPTTATLRERLDQGQGLTSPELSVLAAYAKIELATALRDSDLADDPWFGGTLRRYFPAQLAERFDAELDTHPLRREIIATVVANDMINLGGITFAFRTMEETSASPATVARAFVALREVFDLDGMTDALNALPSSFPTGQWTAIHLDIRRLLDRAVRWQVNQGDTHTVAEVVEKYKPHVHLLRSNLTQYLQGADLKRLQAQMQQAEEWGVPEALGHQWAELFEAFALLDVARVAARTQEPVEVVAAVYYLVYDRFRVDDILVRITGLPRKDRWQSLARAALRDDLYSTVADMAKAILESTEIGTAEERLLSWEALNVEKLERARSVFEEVNALGQDDMASLSVALRLLRSIVRR